MSRPNKDEPPTSLSVWSGFLLRQGHRAVGPGAVSRAGRFSWGGCRFPGGLAAEFIRDFMDREQTPARRATQPSAGGRWGPAQDKGESSASVQPREGRGGEAARPSAPPERSPHRLSPSVRGGRAKRPSLTAQTGTNRPPQELPRRTRVPLGGRRWVGADRSLQTIILAGS